MWIEREIQGALERMAKAFPSVLITGPRQVGKTSLIKHHFPKAAYFSFDSPTLARQVLDSPNEFLKEISGPAIFDEIQYVPNLFRYLKLKIDQNNNGGRFLLTGSQVFPLMQGVSESLAGRCGILQLASLSYDEVSHAKSSFLEEEYIVRGGFPSLYSGTFEVMTDWYISYLATYLERDVRNIKNVGDLRDFERFMRAVALRSGQLLSYSDLARDVGVAPNTAKQWISVLMASGQIFLLEPYHRSLGKRLIKSPKLYFLDTGLLCYLVGIETVSEWKRSPLASAIWETYIVGQILRYFDAQGKRPPIWFWHTPSNEVDILIEKGGRFVAIECKLTEDPTENALDGFQTLMAFYGKEILEKGFIACRTPHHFKFSSGPFWAVHGSPHKQW